MKKFVQLQYLSNMLKHKNGGEIYHNVMLVIL